MTLLLQTDAKVDKSIWSFAQGKDPLHKKFAVPAAVIVLIIIVAISTKMNEHCVSISTMLKIKLSLNAVLHQIR